MRENDIAIPFWYGNLYGDRITTYEEFTEDWKHHCFDGTQPDKGRCFIIVVDNKRIGQVNYNGIGRDGNSVDVDIVIADNMDVGKVYGLDALGALCSFIFMQRHEHSGI